jgi:ketosteroid isomerase-like protein
MRINVLFVSCLLVSLGASFNSSSTDKARAEILHVHELDRAAHLRGDAADLASRVARELIVVDQGKIARNTPADVQHRFEEYFLTAKHSAWEDLEPPIIQISSGDNMAWAIYRVRSQYIETKPDGTKESGDFVGAWTSTYERIDNRWLMTSVTSTFEPEK